LPNAATFEHTRSCISRSSHSRAGSTTVVNNSPS
jgi:hypothetical protein